MGKACETESYLYEISSTQWLSHRSLIGLRLLCWMVLWWNGHPESSLWAMGCIGKPAMAQRLGTSPQFQLALVLHKNTWPSFQPLKLANCGAGDHGSGDWPNYCQERRLPQIVQWSGLQVSWHQLAKVYTNCVQLPVWPCFDLDSLNQGRRRMRGWRVASQSTWVAGIGPFRNRCSNMRRPTSQLTIS